MKFARREPSPPTPDTVIWRYLEDWKFEDLLMRFTEHDQWPNKNGKRKVHHNEPGQMWFAFPRTFEDEKEGHFPDANDDPEVYCDRMAARMGLSEEEARNRKERFLAADTQTMRDAIFSMAQICGVSCWSASNCESAEMWFNFVSSPNGVAIRSTCAQVEHALTHAHNTPARKAKPSICAVGYVDHSSYFLAEDGFRNLLAIVQESWSYENEVRFVAKSPALAAIPTQVSKPGIVETLSAKEKQEHIATVAEQARTAYVALRQSRSEGFHLPIDLAGMIAEIVLKPGSSQEYSTIVRDLVGKANLGSVPIRTSSL